MTISLLSSICHSSLVINLSSNTRVTSCISWDLEFFLCIMFTCLVIEAYFVIFGVLVTPMNSGLKNGSVGCDGWRRWWVVDGEKGRSRRRSSLQRRKRGDGIMFFEDEEQIWEGKNDEEQIWEQECGTFFILLPIYCYLVVAMMKRFAGREQEWRTDLRAL